MAAGAENKTCLSSVMLSMSLLRNSEEEKRNNLNVLASYSIYIYCISADQVEMTDFTL